VSIIDLDLVALIRPACFLILGMEIYAGVCAGFGHNFGLDFEILEVGVVNGPNIEKMTAGAIHNYHTVADTESVFVLAGLPAIEALTVKKTLPLPCFAARLFLRP
jgi:hypothetical protein